MSIWFFFVKNQFAIKWSFILFKVVAKLKLYTYLIHCQLFYNYYTPFHVLSARFIHTDVKDASQIILYFLNVKQM